MSAFIDRYSGKIGRVTFTASAVSGTKKIRVLVLGLFSSDITVTTEEKRYSYAVADPNGTNRYLGIVNDVAGTLGTINIRNVQFEFLTASTNSVGEFVPTATVQVTKFFTYANPYSVVNNVVIDSGVRTPIGTQDGMLVEPTSTNKCTCWGVPRADVLGTELVSGTATLGKVYEITARVALDWEAVGTRISGTANTVGARYCVTGSLTFTASEKGKEVTDSVGQKSYYSGSFQNTIPNMTLSGDTSAVLSIVDDTAAVEAAGLGNVCNGGKVYKLDNSAGVALANVDFAGALNATLGSHSVYARCGDASANSYLFRTSSTSAATSGIYATNTAWGKVKKENITLLTTDRYYISVSAGKTLYFILPQLEEYPVATSVMPSLGVAGTRAVQSLSEQTSGNLPAESAVVNLIANSQDFSQATWVKSLATVTGTNTINVPNLNDQIGNTSSIGTKTAGSKLLISVKVSGVAGETISLRCYDGASTYSQITLSATPTVVSYLYTVGTTATISVYFRKVAGDTASSFVCDWFQVEDITANPTKQFTGYVPTTTAALTALPAIYVGNPGWTLKLTYKYLGGATATLPHTLWSTWADANNFVSLQYNGVIAYITKCLAGVKTYVTFPLTAAVGASYNLTMRLNQDYTFQLFVGGVGAGNGLGSELITNGGFTGGTTGWTITPSWSYGTNNVNHVNGTAGSLNQPVTSQGNLYRTSVDSSFTSGTGLKVILAGLIAGNFLTSPTVMTTVQDLFATYTGTTGGLFAYLDTICTVDNVSIKQINNSTDSTIPIYAPTFHIGDFATATPSLHANGMIKDVKIYSVALPNAQC
jgi:hypothetical protein